MLLTIYYWSSLILIGSSESCSNLFSSKLKNTFVPIMRLNKYPSSLSIYKMFRLSMFSPAHKWNSGPTYIHTLVISTKTLSCYQLQKLPFFIVIYLEKLDYPVRINLHRERTSAYRRPQWHWTTTTACILLVLAFHSFLITMSPNAWQKTLYD